MENEISRTRRYKILAKLYLRYALKSLSGQTAQVDQIMLDKRFNKLFDKLKEAFNTYNPGDRDYVKGIYLSHNQFPPSEHIIKIQSAHLAAEAVLIIDKMSRGELSPTAFMPLISPLEIEYYKERVDTYLEWLDSQDELSRKIPVPFFYAIAAENLSKQTVWESSEEKAKIQLAPRLSLQVASNGY